ncbi:MAG: substrate-binding domain-containing protein [Clostridia bacterium]|nr:substrate-binding domain-containing protein [Clostridia bacterium]
MKKIVAIVLTLVLALAATAIAETVNVGFVQLIDMADATKMYDGFMATIEASGLDINVDFQDASGDQTAMATMLQSFVDKEYDIVVPMLTPPAIAAAAICEDIPMVFMSVTEPVYAHLLDAMDAPTAMRTGTSNRIPAELSLACAEALTPADGKTCVIMYNADQVNAVATKDGAVAYCEENGIAYREEAYTDINTALQIAQSLSADDTAYVYVALDSTIANNFNQVGEALKEAGIASYTAADAMVTGGGAFSFSIDYTNIGVMTANMVIDYVNGTSLDQMPVQRVEDFNLVYNTEVIEVLGVAEDDVKAYAESIGLPCEAVTTVTAN